MTSATPAPAPLTPRLVRGRALAMGGVCVAVVCLALMTWVDVPLAVAMHTLAHTPFVAVFAVVTILGNSGFWFALAVIGIVRTLVTMRGDTVADNPLRRQRLRAWTFMIVSMAASGLLVNGIKMLVGRGRPNFYLTHGMTSFTPLTTGSPDSWSFPSGHTQSIWAAMVALAWIYPPLRWPCFMLAVAVSASRIIVGAHYLSDVVAGAYLAIAVAVLCRALFERNGIGLDLSAAPASSTG